MATTNRNYPLPDPENHVADDVLVLIAALEAIDIDVHTLLGLLSGKAATVHTHGMDQVTGLVAALGNKAAADFRPTLGGLANVDASVDTADPGTILMKGPTGWTFQTPATALGSHTHVIGNIEGLATILGNKLDAANLPARLLAYTTKATPVDADTFVGLDSAASSEPKRFSWAGIKATLKSYFDAIYATVGHVHAAASTSAAGFMSNSDKAKLDGIAAGATVTPGAATTSAAGLMSSTDKTRLDSIATEATKNAADEFLIARANHTGTQDANTLTGTIDPARLPRMSAGSVVLCVPNGNGSFDTAPATGSNKQAAVDFIALAAGTVTMSAEHRQDSADGSTSLRYLEFRKNGASVGNWVHTTTAVARTVNVTVAPGDILSMVLSAVSPGSPHVRTAYLTNGKITASSKDAGLVIPLATQLPYQP